jgi:hypothetical protein
MLPGELGRRLGSVPRGTLVEPRTRGNLRDLLQLKTGRLRCVVVQAEFWRGPAIILSIGALTPLLTYIPRYLTQELRSAE